MVITVFTKQSCVQCTATYRSLDSSGITYEIRDVVADAAALEQVKALGYLQAPVVIVADHEDTPLEHWCGYRPDKIQALAQRLGAAA